MASLNSNTIKTLLFGPREEVLYSVELEYREANVKTYKELMEVGSLFGTDYTALKEFLGIACIAAVLRANCYQAEILIAGNTDANDADLVRQIVSSDPDVLGISLLYDLQLSNAIRIAHEVKKIKPNTKILLGGAFATASAEVIMNKFSFIDFVIKGEGEDAVIELYRVLEGMGDISQVSGLVYRSDDKIRSNSIKCILNLDKIPLPARDILSNMKNKKTPIGAAYLYSSRGCKGACVFCCVPDLNRNHQIKWRCRDPVLVVDEIEQLVKKFNIRFFYFTDDNFYGYSDDNEKRLYTFANEIIKRNLKIQFHAECRVDSLDEQVLIKLKDAGLSQLLLGIESGSDFTLKRWGKKQSVKDNERALQLGKKHGFDLMPSIILIDWESTLEEVDETVDFIGRNKIYEIQYPLALINKMHILRGTAAARRYDKWHPNKGELHITSDLCNLNEWIVKYTYQDIKTEDIYVAAFWKYLSIESNRWYVISQEIIPQFLLSIRKSKRKDKKAVELIQSCGNWRNALGYHLFLLMRYLADGLLALKAKGSYDLEIGQDISEFVRKLEKENFPEGIEEELLLCKKEANQ